WTYLDDDHPRLVQRRLEPCLTIEELERARRDLHGAVAPDGVRVHPAGTLSRDEMHCPYHALAHGVPPRGTIRRERQLLRRDPASDEYRHEGERETSGVQTRLAFHHPSGIRVTSMLRAECFGVSVNSAGMASNA